jgi:hypothetical protein
VGRALGQCRAARGGQRRRPEPQCQHHGQRTGADAAERLGLARDARVRLLHAHRRRGRYAAPQQEPFAGAAHLKTGSLRDSAALAGYVDGASGQRYVLVAMANHANAAAARTAWDALVDWTAAQ